MSIITLNVNGFNAPTKRHRLAEWIQKQDPYICCLQETHFRPQDTYSGDLEDGGGIGRGDHFLFYKFIKRTTER